MVGVLAIKHVNHWTETIARKKEKKKSFKEENRKEEIL